MDVDYELRESTQRGGVSTTKKAAAATPAKKGPKSKTTNGALSGFNCIQALIYPGPSAQTIGVGREAS
jgi:hypothetical protein